LNVLAEEKLVQRAAELVIIFYNNCIWLKSPLITAIRGKGLLIGISINPSYYSARDICLRLMEQGVLSKETHQTGRSF